MREFAPGLWIEPIPLRFLGTEFGARMTVVRLPGGGLVVHSPVRLTEARRAALDALGPVCAVIAPNRLHHLFVGDFVAAYPKAAFHCSPALRAKRPDIPWTAVLGDTPDPLWAGVLDQCPVRGSLHMDEVAFLHRAAGTLLLCDLLEYFDGVAHGWLFRLLARWAGVWRRYGLTRDQRLLFRDRDALRQTLRTVLAWDFDRIVLAHGPLVESGGKAILREAFSWLEPI
jgi:hypothetical protein